METGQHTLVELFEAVAARFPDRVAVTADDRRLTYRDLDARAGAIARSLRESGAGPGSRVGLLVPRASALPVGLLGILKSGAAYVPLDPGHPVRRIAWALDDTDVTRIVTTPELAERFGSELGADLVLVGDDVTDERVDNGAAPEDLAYVVHTSGSTGLPKGVQVEHRHVVRLFAATRDLFHTDENDVWTLFHSIAFDFSVWEFWGALLSGGRLVVVPQPVARSPRDLHGLLRREQVTVLSQTPSAFTRLAAVDERSDSRLRDLRVVVFGGERLEPAALRSWFDRYGERRPRLVNMYGVTEVTVHASYRALTAADADAHADADASRGASPIGVPLADLAFQVLDETGRPVPEGTPGELYVSGAGLARGYLNRPQLQKERFLELVGADDVIRRWYRTGDRVVALGEGDGDSGGSGYGGYGYLGRTDDQMKIRGYRVEPGEIEAVLLADPDVHAAVAVAHEYGEGDVRVLAHVASGRPASVLAPRLGELAASSLPPHMRPSAYVVLPELPITPNGKVDRGRLPGPEAAHAPVVAEGDGPSPLSDTERRIAAIWRGVLDLPDVGRDTGFFDLGGTSLSLLRMFARTNEEFGTDLDITALIDGATVTALARHVDVALSGTAPATPANRPAPPHPPRRDV